MRVGLLLLTISAASCSEPYVRPRSRDESSDPPDDDPHAIHLRLKMLQLVVQHGDRTPVTPLKDASFWRSTLPAPEQLADVAAGTELVWTEREGPPPLQPPQVIVAKRQASQLAALARGREFEADKAEELRKQAGKARNRAEESQEAARLVAFRAMELAHAANESGTADEAGEAEVERLRGAARKEGDDPKREYPATIVKVHDCGTVYDIKYDDGDSERRDPGSTQVVLPRFNRVAG